METSLCLDVGSTSIKGAVINPSHNIYMTHKHVLSIEPSIEELSNAFLEVIKQLSDMYRGGDITSIIVCGNGPSLVINPELDSRYCVYWYKEARERQESLSFYLPLLSQMNTVEKKALRAALPLPEYLCTVLGGAQKTILPVDSYGDFILSKEDCANHQLPQEHLLDYHPIHDQLGLSNQKSMQILKVAETIPLFCGGTDYLMDILGIDELNVFDLVIRVGTRVVCNCIIDAPSVKYFDDCVVLPYLVDKTYTAAIFYSDESKKLRNAVQDIINEKENASLLTYFEELANAFDYDTVLDLCALGLMFRYRLNTIETRSARKFGTVHLSGEFKFFDVFAELFSMCLGRQVTYAGTSMTSLMGCYRLSAHKESIHSRLPWSPLFPGKQRIRVTPDQNEYNPYINEIYTDFSQRVLRSEQMD